MDNRPPPRPGQPDTGGAGTGTGTGGDPNNDNGNRRHHHHHHTQSKRSVFANRSRTLSSGSTRGAFGPMPIESAENHEDIYEMQAAAMKNNFRNINVNVGSGSGVNGPPVSQVTLGHAHGHGHGGIGSAKKLRSSRKLMDGNGNGMVHSTSHSSALGHSSHNDNSTASEKDLARIAAAAMNDEEANLGIYGSNNNTNSSHGHGDGDGHPLSKRSSTSDRVPSTTSNSNTRFMFSHHAPTFEDLKAAADKQAEISMFSSMATSPKAESRKLHREASANNINGMKYTGYGSNDQSWEDNGKGIGNGDTGTGSDNDNDNMSYDDTFGEPAEQSSIQQFLKTVFYDSDKPEFTSLQQTSWAVLLGIFMGIFTAFWGRAVEGSVEFVWSTLPAFLLEQGVFTDLDGALPLPHYIWICPAIFGGVSLNCYCYCY